MYKAIITKSSKREYECYSIEKKESVIAVALREVLRSDHLVVGDEVLIRPIENDDKYEIYEMLDRRSEVFRKIVRINRKKIIAANIDNAIIVSAVSKPQYKANLIDRYLTRAIQWKVNPIIIFNKMDQFDNQFDLSFEKEKFDYLGIKYFEISSKSDKWASSMQQFQESLKGKTNIFLGQSGVGKSALINNITEGEFSLKTNRLALGVDKGSHTTTWSEYFRYNDFALIDSPGIRSLAMNDLEIEDLDFSFDNIKHLSQNCKFRDCKHQKNSKDCYFNTLSSDSTENKILLNRLESYKKLKEEIESIPAWKKN